LRPVLAVLAGFATIALVAAWLVPQWLDWTRYRSTIEALASATLGQPVAIQGPISLTLLPQPILTAAQVTVGGQEPARLAFHVDALRLRVALWPLIAGRVDARELVLRGPDLRIPWPVGGGAFQARPPGWLAAFAIRIENGRLTAGRLAFTGIDATLATLDTGALSAAGTAQLSGLAWHFTARLTTAGADGAAGLNATLDGQGSANGIGASFTGQLAGDGTLAGSIASRGPNLAVLLPAPATPFRADGRLIVGGGLAAIDDLALEIGGAPASGALALRVVPQQRLDIALSAGRLDLDAWLPVLRTATGGLDMPVGFDLSAESAALSGGTLEHLRAAFSLNGSEMVIRDATASLPGHAGLHVSGRVRDDPAQARFVGYARLDAPQLRTTLRWLDAAMPGALPSGLLDRLPDGSLQRAVLAAGVELAHGNLALTDLAGTVDGAPVAGSVGLKRGMPPAITADLSADDLPLDPWLPAHLPGLADLFGLAKGTDAALRLRIRHTSLAGAAVENFDLDAAIEAGGIWLRRAEASMRGAHVVASGLLGGDGRLSDGTLSIETGDASPVAALLPGAWRATPAFWHGPAKLDLHAAGPPEELAVSAQVALGDAHLDAKPTVDLRSGAWTGTLTLHHPGARRLISALGVPVRYAVGRLVDGLGDGSLSLVAHVASSADRVAMDAFDLAAAGLHADGNILLERDGPEPRMTGHVHLDALPVLPEDANPDAPLPIGLLHGWQGNLHVEVGTLFAGFRPVLSDTSADLVVTDDALRLQRIAGRLGSGTVAGDVAFDAAARPPSLAVDLRLRDAVIAGPLDDAPVDLLSGRAEGKLRLTANGYSPSALLATLDGRLALSVTGGVLSGFDLFRMKLAVEKADARSTEATVGDALAAGATGFDRLDLSAGLSHGDLSLDAGLLTSIAGEARFTGGVNLPSRALDVEIALQPALPNPPAIAIHLSGPLDHPDRAPELAGLARWMAELAR
jgi:uncharacterized protein involved in outer membrane biogenesis